MEILDTIGHKSALLTSLYSYIVEAQQPTSKALNSHLIWKFIVKFLKYFQKTILYFYKVFQFEKNENLNQIFLYEFSNNLTHFEENSQPKHFYYLNTNEIYKNRRQKRDETLNGIIFNSLYALFPTFLTFIHSSSTDLPETMTTNILYTLEILSNLLFHPITAATPAHNNFSTRYIELYLNLILTHFIFFEIKINKFIIHKNYHLIKKFKVNNTRINKINFFNNVKTNQSIPNIIKIRNNLNCHINKIIIHFINSIKIQNLPKECQIRINEIILSNHKSGEDKTIDN